MITDERGKEGEYRQVLDALRAENEALKAQHPNLADRTNDHGSWVHIKRTELDALRAENELARATVAAQSKAVLELTAENERLVAALVFMVETFGPISDISAAGASQPAIEQAREALARTKRA